MFSFEKKISKKKFTLLLILNFPPPHRTFWQKNYKIVAAFCVLSSPFFLQNKESIFANNCNDYKEFVVIGFCILVILTNLILFANFSNRSCIWGHETTTYNTPSYSYNLLQNKKFPSKEKKWLVTKF
jgi:hypothetical protein